MISRREILKAAASFIALRASGNAFASGDRERIIRLHHVHTGEHLVVPYFACGAYDTQALYEINRLLRCHFTDEVIPIDVGLVDLLHEVTTLVGGTNPVHVVSGYRSPAYNTYLKSLGRKVARSSLHLQGQAVDFSIPDVLPKQLARAARSLAAGGVGEYRNFVHIDIGRVRYW